TCQTPPAPARGGPGPPPRLVADLLGRATRAEQDFLARALLGELRQGALEGLMVEAVARAAGLPVADVRRALMVSGDLGAVARAALGEGAAGLGRFAVQLFRPLKPMLAQTADTPAAALAQLGAPAAFEYKLDGARVQAHKDGETVRVFSRRLNEVTAAVPEVVEALRALPARRLILDGEAIGLRPDGLPQPFQVTMRRFGRRLEVERLRRTIPLQPLFFDCLLVDDQMLFDRPWTERVAALAATVPASLVIQRRITAEAVEADAFLEEALAHGHEGVMAKSPGAPYEAGARGGSWLKIKAAVTLDLVVLAAEWGHGRRTGLLSNLHLGARDPATGGFVMLGKTFKGTTDEMLAWQTEALQRIAVARDAYTVQVEPRLVVEVAFNDIQESPHYPGGLALRCGGVKGYRPDKRPEEADTIDTVRLLFERRRGGAPAVAATG
ncbi:MAG: ATP-dependent DNA ligase, partial [Rhodospirillaceae bacterium]|nr:ATP-dependent DNA ligase [Rhodospirillaceae bacterium]